MTSVVGADEALAWAQVEFGHTSLGDVRRTSRLVAMVSTLVVRAAGKISEVFSVSSEREAAYRFVENPRVKANEIGKAANLAAARRCNDMPFAYVPVDGTSLSLKDPRNIRGVGPVGARSKKGRGIEVMTAIAVAPDGTPLGVTGQTYWVRDEKPAGNAKKRSFEDKETRHWLDTIEQTQAAFREIKNGCVPWYQLDRGGDFRQLLAWASQAPGFVTVRAAQNRRIEDSDARYLWQHLIQEQPAGTYAIDVAQGPRRTARKATIAVRHETANIKVEDRSGGQRVVELHAVLAQETGTTPPNEKPIEWLLLTTYPVESFDDAVAVIRGYTCRWRIEEFHKSWKSANCNVEDNQLRDLDAIIKWARLSTSVALRIERLKYLARNRPKAPATEELTRFELDAIIMLRKPKGFLRGATPPIGMAVRWLADMGGYTGKSSGGPPGAIVIGRGLKGIQSAAKLLETMH